MLTRRGFLAALPALAAVPYLCRAPHDDGPRLQALIDANGGVLPQGEYWVRSYTILQNCRVQYCHFNIDIGAGGFIFFADRYYVTDNYFQGHNHTGNEFRGIVQWL